MYDFDKLFQIYNNIKGGKIKNIHRGYNVCKANGLEITQNAFYQFVKGMNIIQLLEEKNIDDDLILEVAKELSIDNIYKLYRNRKDGNQ